MKAFLLAAGHGTRLRPLTDNLPKCLVPIRGIPMLHIWLEICRHYGITDLFINLHAHADVVRNDIRNITDGVRVVLCNEESLLGSAGTLLANRKWVEQESEFWVLYADVLTNLNFGEMLQFHRLRKPTATLGLYQVAEPSRCGIVGFDENLNINEFEEKPAKPKSNWAFSGIMIATPLLMAAIPPRFPVDLGYDVLPTLVGKMAAFRVSNYLIDIGTMESYTSAQATWPGLGSEDSRHAG